MKWWWNHDDDKDFKRIVVEALHEIVDLLGEIRDELKQSKPNGPTGFSVTTVTNNDKKEKGNLESMTKSKFQGRMKLDIHDNGTATATLGFVDAAGLAIATLPAGSTLPPPPWATSDPGLVLTPAADGLSCLISPSAPPVLVTGAVVTAGPDTYTDPTGNQLAFSSVSTEPLNVVAGGPAGFSIEVA